MQTIGRRYHGPRRNYAKACDYCGVMWHRHQLVIDANGLLACPDDRAGRTEKELDQQIALDSAEPSLGPTHSGGR